MSVKRTPRKAVTPAAMPVPRLRTIRCDDSPAPGEVRPTVAARPRRNRKPKFVF